MAARSARRPPARRTPPSPRKRGAVAGFRQATHTDNLGYRIGSWAGRALIRRLNRRRLRQGKPLIATPGHHPIHTGRPVRGRPVRMEPGRPSRTSTTRVPRGAATTPTVTTVTTRTRITKTRTIRRPLRTDTETPPPAPPAPQPAPTQPEPPQPTPPRTANPPTGPTAPPPGSTVTEPGSSTAATTSGGTMSLDHLGEAPETSSQHLANGTAIAQGIRELAEQCEQYAEACVNTGMDPAALQALQATVEQLGEAAATAEGINGEFSDYYGGVLEHVDGGKKIFTENGQSDWWDGKQ